MQVDQARAKGASPEHWNLKDLMVMVSWFKCPGESKMPDTRPKLFEKYELTKNPTNEQERKNQKQGEEEEAVVDEQDSGNGGEGAEVKTFSCGE